jgi:hypothetical protein
MLHTECLKQKSAACYLFFSTLNIQIFLVMKSLAKANNSLYWVLKTCYTFVIKLPTFGANVIWVKWQISPWKNLATVILPPLSLPLVGIIMREIFGILLKVLLSVVPSWRDQLQGGVNKTLWSQKVKRS